MNQSVNLFRDDLVPKDSWVRTMVLAGLFGAMFLWSSVSAVHEHLALASAESRVEQLTLHLGTLNDQNQSSIVSGEQQEIIEQDIEMIEIRLAQINAQRAIVGSTPGKDFHRFFEALEAHAGQGVWLNTISIRKSGSELDLGGHSLNAAAVTTWLKLLVEDSLLPGFRVEQVQIGGQQSGAGKSASAFTARVRN